MATRLGFFEGSNNEHVDLQVINVEGDLNQYTLPVDGRGIAELLQPITDASHTRDRKRSPPDSACLPGTRKAVIKWIISWASSKVFLRKQHVLFVYGHAGCGKSAIAQEISEQVQGGGRLLATFFFFRNEGDRSKIGRLPNTLASQMALSLPETAPLIEAAVKAEPELLKVKSSFSFSARLQRLLYEPFKTVAGQASRALAKFLTNPYLIVIDGLDECKDKEGVQEFITTTLRFFESNPAVPLRILITSRVEQHIHPLLTADSGVLLKDLADHCTRKDIETFMQTVFEAETRSNPVVQAHIRQNGPWPSEDDSRKLVDHIGGSFIFASTLFKFIFRGTSPDDLSTPLERFPLALNIDPGLDGLYSQTLARSENLPHFPEIIATLTLLAWPLPISGIAELLDIQASAVAHVLVDLQAIIRTAAVQYSLDCRELDHGDLAYTVFKFSDLEQLVKVRRDTIELLPKDEMADGLIDLGMALLFLSEQDWSTSTIEEAILFLRKALILRPLPDPDRSIPLDELGSTLSVRLTSRRQ
ncbi:hypothetical protein MD484_g1334, partial [Candolleomyces efflorescens]